MFLAKMCSKYGTDIELFGTQKEAEKACDEHCRALDKRSDVDRFSYELGPSDSWVIYEIPVYKGTTKESHIKYLNELFNKINVNPHLLKVIQERDE